MEKESYILENCVMLSVFSGDSLIFSSFFSLYGPRCTALYVNLVWNLPVSYLKGPWIDLGRISNFVVLVVERFD